MRILIALFVLLSATIARAQVIIPSPPKHMFCVVLGGQSNGVGQAALDADHPILGSPIHSFMLTLGQKWVKRAFEPSHTTDDAWGGSAYPPIIVPNDPAGAGAGVHMLNRLGESMPKRNLALINVSVGGRHLAQYLPGTLIYKMMITQMNIAKPYCDDMAFVFVQGESDASTADRALNWYLNVSTLLAALRKKFGRLPTVIVQLGDQAGDDGVHSYIHWNDVKLRQAKAAKMLPDIQLVVTEGLKKYSNAIGGEGVHYLATSYQTWGYEAALALAVLAARQ
jgi:hypothetical protein